MAYERGVDVEIVNEVGVFVHEKGNAAAGVTKSAIAVTTRPSHLM